MLNREETLIPPYPVINVDVYPDGSAHLNVAGRHVDFPPAVIEDTRAAIVSYAVTVAEQLGRPVRMAATDHDGTFTVGVHPTGHVTDLPGATAPPKRRRKATAGTPAAVQPHTSGIDSVDAAPASDPPGTLNIAETPLTAGKPGEDTRMVPLPTSRWAVLAFSTGQRCTITHAAIIGRWPTPPTGDDTAELIALDDPSQTVSKTHLHLQWRSHSFWAIDCGSGNGTTLHRQGQAALALAAGQAVELQHGMFCFSAMCAFG